MERWTQACTCLWATQTKPLPAAACVCLAICQASERLRFWFCPGSCSHNLTSPSPAGRMVPSVMLGGSSSAAVERPALGCGCPFWVRRTWLVPGVGVGGGDSARRNTFLSLQSAGITGRDYRAWLIISTVCETLTYTHKMLLVIIIIIRDDVSLCSRLAWKYVDRALPRQ